MIRNALRFNILSLAILLGLSLVGFSEGAMARSSRRCGSTLRDVRQIILQRYRNLRADHVDGLKGTWRGHKLGMSMDMVISEGNPFKFDKWTLTACPCRNGDIDIQWTEDGTKAGTIVFTPPRPESVAVEGTKAGTIELTKIN